MPPRPFSRCCGAFAGAATLLLYPSLKFFGERGEAKGSPKTKSPRRNPRLDTSKLYPPDAADEAPRSPVAGWLRWLLVDMARPWSQRASNFSPPRGQTVRQKRDHADTQVARCPRSSQTASGCDRSLQSHAWARRLWPPMFPDRPSRRHDGFFGKRLPQSPPGLPPAPLPQNLQ